MEKKMTYVVALENAIAVVENAEVRDRLADLKASLEKKASNKKATKTQTENVELKGIIVELLGQANAPMTATEILKSDERLVSIQKVSALLKQLVESNEIVKTVDKKKSLFSLA